MYFLGHDGRVLTPFFRSIPTVSTFRAIVLPISNLDFHLPSFFFFYVRCFLAIFSANTSGLLGLSQHHPSLSGRFC